MGTSKKADLLTGICLVLAAVGIYLEAAKMPNYGGGIGSGGYPAFVAVGLFILGLLLAGGSALQLLSGFKIPDKKLTGLPRVIFYCVLILVYIWAMDYIGFNAASILFLIASLAFFGYEKGLVRAVVFSVGITVISYIIFRYGFLVLLPVNRFW